MIHTDWTKKIKVPIKLPIGLLGGTFKSFNQTTSHKNCVCIRALDLEAYLINVKYLAVLIFKL